MTKAAQDRTAVYRFFSADGWLLYVGMTVNTLVRFAHHRASAPWWHLADQNRTAITWYDSRTEAASAEIAAIEAEKPEWNIAGREDRHVGRPKTVLTASQEAALEDVAQIYAMHLELREQYKRMLAELADREGDPVPISHIAERLGLQRKTVYRHLGRSIT
jgi:predicted transcriptional regulator